MLPPLVVLLILPHRLPLLSPAISPSTPATIASSPLSACLKTKFRRTVPRTLIGTFNAKQLRCLGYRCRNDRIRGGVHRPRLLQTCRRGLPQHVTNPYF
ncbi:hypothetical protein SCLCIDRAFT_751816 [Scleroderma citrinum Foug A]|uniref:Secreted protein n=1 Tax=Scleroderma citrinum Foug A TaxID=1036808 RepID=A0A0C3D3Z1_9AGAM|nr:hypothetical protein SCLCIDRAFT_751816 [Scleroderma citrinum Foug A]